VWGVSARRLVLEASDRLGIWVESQRREGIMGDNIAAVSTICPNCGCRVRADRLQKHLRKVHHARGPAKGTSTEAQPIRPEAGANPDEQSQACIQRVAERTGMDPERVERFFEYVQLEWVKLQPTIRTLLPYFVFERALYREFDSGHSPVTAKELADIIHRQTSRDEPRWRGKSVYAISIPMGGDPHYKLKDNRR
jgi:hypothetical protein